MYRHVYCHLDDGTGQAQGPVSTGDNFSGGLSHCGCFSGIDHRILSLKELG
jgi:hypothetical protein